MFGIIALLLIFLAVCFLGYVALLISDQMKASNRQDSLGVKELITSLKSMNELLAERNRLLREIQFRKGEKLRPESQPLPQVLSPLRPSMEAPPQPVEPLKNQLNLRERDK